MSEISGGSGLSLDNTMKTFGQGMDKMEADVASAQEAAQSGNTADTMKLQFAIQKWSIMTSMESNMSKAIADALRSIVKNMN
ncbi:MAG: hypothetical protein GDA50_07210 [Alphaproteobacteria bacterium GM202ARS2]|nr:hypothetical protein [Alphaproteobacteria bacterium GM202ARS2]